MSQGYTIAAITTPRGVGGIGAIRISGGTALGILLSIIKTIDQTIKPRRLYNAIIEGVDDIMFVYMKAPKSYTGEDVVEMFCHGGQVVPGKVLELCIEAGARLAGNGEFTRRAYLNGKMDLAQAEGVVEMVSAKSWGAANAAYKQLKGSLSELIKKQKDELIGLIAEVEAGVDFPEDVEVDRERIARKIDGMVADNERLIKTAGYGKMIREGARVVIVGKTNVGKSSLLNALIKEERAIVTRLPGTTRDVIEESICINGLAIVLHDTAGIREPMGEAEGVGIEKAKRAIESADLIIQVYDGTIERIGEDQGRVEKLVAGRVCLNVINKCDLGIKIGVEGIRVSALTGEGIAKLEDEIYRRLIGRVGQNDCSVVLANERHRVCMIRANESLKRANDSIKMGRSAELFAIDIREAVAEIDEISGYAVSDEIVDRIFGSFCIGK